MTGKPASGGQSTVPAQSSSAQGAGLSSSTGPGQSVMSCQATTTSYQPCDVQSVNFEITREGGAHSIDIASKRRTEPVAENVYRTYQPHLRDYDLLLEVLAPVKEETTTYDFSTGTTQTEADKGQKPVKVKATTTMAASCGTLHPGSSLRGHDGVETVNQPVHEFELTTPPPSLAGSSRWARIWPFRYDRQNWPVFEAYGCGINPGGPPVEELAAKFVVMPDEKWKITFGLGTLSSGSASIERARRTGPDRAQTGTMITRTRQRGSTTTRRRETYIANTDYSDEFSVSETSGVIRRTTETLAESDSTWGDPSFKHKESVKASKIKIEHTVGGQTAEISADKVINGVLQVMDTIEDLSKLFDGIPRIGWSIKTSFSFLQGQAHFEWGHRWPQTYEEENRVYYVERYLEVGGSVELASGKVEVFFGIEIDPWWLDFYFVAKLYLEISAKVAISPSASVNCKNRADMDLYLNPVDLDAKAEIKAELGATSGGRAFGWEVRATLKLESSITFTVDGKIAYDGPEAKATLTSSGAHIVGEILLVGRRRKKYDFEPLEVIKDREFFKDKVLF